MLFFFSFAVPRCQETSVSLFLAPHVFLLLQFFAVLLLVPESPRWLLQRQRKAKALRALEALGESSMDAGSIVVQQSERYLPHRQVPREGGGRGGGLAAPGRGGGGRGSSFQPQVSGRRNFVRFLRSMMLFRGLTWETTLAK